MPRFECVWVGAAWGDLVNQQYALQLVVCLMVRHGDRDP